MTYLSDEREVVFSMNGQFPFRGEAGRGRGRSAKNGLLCSLSNNI